NTQRRIRGHVIIYPQQPSKIADILPPSIDENMFCMPPICILFVGSSRPTPEWIRDHAKPLAVNATRVRNALTWLKVHNPLYRDITVNEECLWQLEENPVLPFNIEHIQNSTADEAATARYDSTPAPGPSITTNDSIPFPNLVIADIECHASSNELRAAALRHVKKKGGGYLEIPHDRTPENEFRKDSLLFPLIYSTLFPYGLGG
ncbi:hypothetical protein C8R45DRAFT_761930, partial [Mycena sanguinolenta]